MIEIQWQIIVNGKHQIWKARGRTVDTRANSNSWETHPVRKRWDIGLLQALSLRFMMMMMTAYVM